MSVFTLVWSLVYLSGFLLNVAGSLVGSRWALAGGASIVLGYVWLSLVQVAALRTVDLTPKAGVTRDGDGTVGRPMSRSPIGFAWPAPAICRA